MPENQLRRYGSLRDSLGHGTFGDVDRVERFWRTPGWQIAKSNDPNRPAVLLVHGMGQSAASWTAPAGHSTWDYRHGPDSLNLGTHSYPNAGIHKVGVSDQLYDDANSWNAQNSWFNFLKSRGFTVATWTQPGSTFDEAYPSVETAFERLLSETGSQPIALVGHSRGGLLIRKLLKEHENTDRVKWAITLHSPHQGSEFARAPAEIGAEAVDLIDYYAPASVTASFKRTLKDIVVELLRPLNKFVLGDHQRELAPDSPLLRSLASGEAPLNGVKYYSFGGTNPTFLRLYMWIFNSGSAVPRYSWNRGQYFKWGAYPVEISGISPLLDKVRDFVPEVKPGYGDGLVTDRSAHLPANTFPNTTHRTTQLNHAEVLWDRPLQQQVANLMATVSPDLEPVIRHPA